VEVVSQQQRQVSQPRPDVYTRARCGAYVSVHCVFAIA
jgi:hypothetical protein